VLLESLLEGMDEFYSINLAREAIKGMAENARNGWYNGGFPPFGYDLTTVKTPKGMKRKLVINASEAKIVRHIFREYLKGKGIVTLTLALNSHDLRIRGGRPFSKNTVANILHNEKYAGDMAFGKRRNREGRQYPVKSSNHSPHNSTADQYFARFVRKIVRCLFDV
jgi:site-specific DNA recombinase